MTEKINNPEEERKEQKESKEEKTTKKFKRKDKNYVAKEEYDAMQDRYAQAMKTAAYYENQSKYYKSEYDRVLKYRSQSLVEDLLPVLDGFQLAFKMEPPNKEATDYRTGFQYVYSILKSVLTNEGVKALVPEVGAAFDAKLQQVVDTIETEDEKQNNHIAEALLNGYMLKDRLIRPASVKIYQLKKATVEDDAQTAEAKKASRETQN